MMYFPQPRYIRWRLDDTGHFVEELPPNTTRMQSWRNKYLLSPDLEAYARRESDEIDPKYSLGWVLLAKIARKMHDEGVLPDQEPIVPNIAPGPVLKKDGAQSRPRIRQSWWRRAIEWFAV